MSHFHYRLLSKSGHARQGEIVTPRGIIRTPAFMPVGTAGTVKALYPEQVRDAGADILLGNTYHLMLRPGAERVARLGGLHEFMRWQGPILTDSGGFQVMSLANLRKMSEDGVTFQSHIDGSKHHVTPERSIEIQSLLGADIQMQLDECIELPATRERAIAAMELSLRWAERSKRAFEARAKPGQALFGIVQGGTDLELRQRSADALVAMDLAGYAVGGLAVGEGHEVMLATLDGTTPHLPVDKPRYLMGVGTPVDIMEAVARGIDMFDCVMPTRSGRHGQAFTWGGKVNLYERPPRRRPAPARCREFVSGGARLFPRLPASSDEVRRISRRDAAVLGQHRLLPGPDVSHPHGNSRRPLRRVRGRTQGAIEWRGSGISSI